MRPLEAICKEFSANVVAVQKKAYTPFLTLSERLRFAGTHLESSFAQLELANFQGLLNQLREKRYYS
jgi:hypothetical protein